MPERYSQVDKNKDLFPLRAELGAIFKIPTNTDLSRPKTLEIMGTDLVGKIHFQPYQEFFKEYGIIMPFQPIRGLDFVTNNGVPTVTDETAPIRIIVKFPKIKTAMYSKKYRMFMIINETAYEAEKRVTDEGLTFPDWHNRDYPNGHTIFPADPHILNKINFIIKAV